MAEHCFVKQTDAKVSTLGIHKWKNLLNSSLCFSSRTALLFFQFRSVYAMAHLLRFSSSLAWHFLSLQPAPHFFVALTSRKNTFTTKIDLRPANNFLLKFCWLTDLPNFISVVNVHLKVLSTNKFSSLLSISNTNRIFKQTNEQTKVTHKLTIGTGKILPNFPSCELPRTKTSARFRHSVLLVSHLRPWRLRLSRHPLWCPAANSFENDAVGEKECPGRKQWEKRQGNQNQTIANQEAHMIYECLEAFLNWTLLTERIFNTGSPVLARGLLLFFFLLLHLRFSGRCRCHRLPSDGPSDQGLGV